MLQERKKKALDRFYKKANPILNSGRKGDDEQFNRFTPNLKQGTYLSSIDKK
jgi:hypothetical protein